MSIFEPLAECGCARPDCYFCQMKDRTCTVATIETIEKQPLFKSKTPEDVLNAVCKLTGADPQEVKSPSRRPKIVTVRHIYCMIANDLTGSSDTEIGRLICRHRTSVIFSINKVKDLLSIGDKEYLNLYYGLTQVLKTVDNYFADR